MPRGRPPKPTRVKVIAGNPGKRPINDREPQPKRAKLACPDWLDKEAKAKWRALVPELERLRLLTLVDADCLAICCQAWAEFVISTKRLQAEGRTTINPDSGCVASHPAVSQQRSAWQAYRQFAALFGLDPSSRSKLSVPPESGARDEFEEFLSNAS